MSVPTPPLPAAEDPLRDAMLWDVELRTPDDHHICRASAALLARASPNCLWPHVRAHRSGKFGHGPGDPLVVGHPGMDAGVARNLVVWSTQLRENEQDAWLRAMLPPQGGGGQPGSRFTADQWRVVLQHLDAARALQLAAAGAAVRRQALRPALYDLIMRPRATLAWRRVVAFTARPYILSAFQMAALPSRTAPWCARLPALGIEVCNTESDQEQGLLVHRVHREHVTGQQVALIDSMPLRRGMVLRRIGATVLDGDTFRKKLGQARAALPPLQAAGGGSAMYARRRVELDLRSRRYTGVRAWAPWPPELLEVHRHLRELDMEDELDLLARLLRKWHHQTLADLREAATRTEDADALEADFAKMVRADALLCGAAAVAGSGGRKRARRDSIK